MSVARYAAAVLVATAVTVPAVIGGAPAAQAAPAKAKNSSYVVLARR